MASTVRVTELCKIVPPPESATESSLPLTFFDVLWLKFHPVERIFFYELTTADSASDFSIVPKLKQSLSRTLLHFLPFAGNLVWPSNSDKPFILYTPGDGVSLTIAESDANFDGLAGDLIHEVPDSRHYVPALNVTEKQAATVSFQITVFPNKGFCIGVSSHHAVFDGKSIILFLNAWAYICKHAGKDNGRLTLPPEMSPVIDRSRIEDSEGLDRFFLNDWISKASKSGKDSNPRSLKLFAMHGSTDTNFVRGTFKFSDEDIKKIRQKAISGQPDKNGNKEDHRNQANSKYYSTFVLAYAYVSIALCKAKGLERKKKLILVFTADGRARFDPPIPANYFGNCLISNFLKTEVGFAVGDNGLVYLVEELTLLVKGLQRGVQDKVKEGFRVFKELDIASTQIIGVAGSPRFGVYSIDFGRGKPKKVEVTSIDKTTTISMAERSDGKGGIEIGVVLRKDEMEIFHSLLLDGLTDL